MKVFVKNILSNKDLQNTNAEVILFNETRSLNSESAELLNTKGVNCSKYRVESSWATWEHDTRLIEGFNKRFPNVLKIGKYDFSLAVLKAVYWSHFKTGQLQFAKQRYPNSEFIEDEPWLKVSKTKTIIKYLILLINFKKSATRKKKKIEQYKTGVLIKNLFEITLYKHVLKALKTNSKACFFVYTTELKQAVLEIGIDEQRIIVLPIIRNLRAPIVNILKIKKNDWYILNQIIRNWQQIYQIKLLAEYISGFGIKKVLINEAENGLVGAAYCEVFKKLGIISYNTMNGSKAGEAQDSYINFDYWFVWDEKMKELLMHRNKLTKNKLIVSGHLMEDEVRNHEYQHTLPLLIDKIKSKKVISFFSIPENCEEKIEVFEFIYKQAKLNKDFIFLIRLHPSEKDDAILMSYDILENIYRINYTQENSKKTLYDQFCVSHLSLCFGSTVALESKWFGVPCITYEKRAESLIYAVDNEWIFHVTNINNLKDLFGNLLKNPKTNKGFSEGSTADLIIENLL